MTRILFLATLIAGSWVTAADGGDWPQILGPDRNGEAIGESIPSTWPSSGPKTLWQRPVGSGFAGAAVVQGTVVLFHRVGNEEIVEALHAASGQPIWKTPFPTDYRPGIVEDDGPRCVPVVHADRVYVYGVQGELRCLELKTGRTVWARDTHEEFQAPEGYFGAGSTPIVEGGRILVNVGGSRTGAGIVAFSLASGDVEWKATQEPASYSSPVAATVDGVRHVIFCARYTTVSLDPESGKTRFEIPFGKRGPTVNAANPTVVGEHLFLTASYGVGAVFADIESGAAAVRWQSDDVLSSQYTTCIHDSGLLYGVHGRQDLGQADLRCIDPVGQKVRWTERGFGYATLLKADGKLLIVKTDGELVLAALNPEAYRELSRARMFPAGSETRALPALSNGRLYVRDAQTLKCVDVGGAGPSN